MDTHAARLSRRCLLRATAGGAIIAALPTGAAAAESHPLARMHDAEHAVRWVSTAYELVLRENLSPPAAARVYAHTAIAMYEALVAGTPSARSLSGSLKGMTPPPPPVGRGLVDWPCALSVAAAAVLREVLPFASPATRPLLDNAERDALRERAAAGVPARCITASVEHGRAVAANLVGWLRQDGHAAIVGRPYQPPTGAPQLWESTPPNYRPAIEPYWSEVRPMVLRSADEVEPEPPLQFSSEKGSAFYEQAMAPYRQSFINGDEQRAIARFWTDNPGSFTAPFGTPTGLPSGHWMQIAAHGVTARGLTLDAAVEALALTGIALHDAFLSCWTWKYRYQLLRPITYVQRYIDPAWQSYINTPQFPEHTSGHSVASPAAAAVLTARLGTFTFTDRSHESRGHAARTFTSFDHAAREAAQSRLYGGIHFPHAISAGLVQGEMIGALVLARVRTRA